MSVNKYIFPLLTLICIVNSLQKNPNIIIVGSGISGLAAATKLWKANFTNIKVLEAESRIGGRINSTKFGDAFVDLGGQWCLGEDNIVYDMVKEYNILKHTNLSIKLFYSNGTGIDEGVYRSLMQFADYLKAPNTSFETKEKCSKLYPSGVCFETIFKPMMVQTYKNEPLKFNVSLEAADWLQNCLEGSPTAFAIADSKLLNWNGLGFKTILDVMLQKYPDANKTLPIENNVALNKEVSKIVWKDGSTAKITVYCTDGTWYKADHVIFTPSLGVLKTTHQKMFEPQLPNEKIEAIEKFGFGSVVKVVLHFPETWWNPQEAYEFVWSTEDKNKISSEFAKGPIKDGRSWLTYSFVFVSADNNPKVLIGFFSGEMVPQIETADNQVLLEGCMYMFRKFLGGKYNIVQADSIIKSIWYSNSHFRGTFSYKPLEENNTGSRYSDNLASPLKQDNGNLALLFAGEATHPTHFSTVQGAIETGYREADRIIQFHAQKDV